MSTLILKYAREHHMGKYTLVAHNKHGSVESNCDLIVRKKQFPPVFWQRLYNVNGEGSRRFVGEVEVGEAREVAAKEWSDEEFLEF